MDGQTLLLGLRQLLQEQSSSSWLDDFTSYDYLYKAAIEFVSRTKILTATQTITTVASQSDYKLNADYLQTYLVDMMNGPFVKYYDGSGTSFVYFREYDPVVLGNQAYSASVPSTYSLLDYEYEENITGTASADGASSGGESTLTVATDLFADANAGDTVYNTSDGSHGIVQEVMSTKVLKTALFGGTNDDWTSADAFILIPQGKMKIIFDPATSTDGHTVTVYYVQRPAPVYSSYRSYRIPIDYKQALIYYATWMYKNRDREPRYADLEYKLFDEQVRKAAYQYGKALQKNRFKVNYMKPGQKHGSWR